MTASPRIELRLFGAPFVRRHERELPAALAQPKRFALLAYLAAATPHGFHRRDTLLGLFWPEADQEHARGALRKATHFLRRELGSGVVVNRGDEELGLAEEGVWCDVVEFQRHLAEDRVADAVALYRGDLLPGFFISGAPEFERWLDEERVRRRAEASEAAWTLAELRERERDHDSAVYWARWAFGLAPDDERGLRRFVTLLGRLGDRAGAVRAYQEFALRLEREYEVTASAETQQLISAVRSGQMDAATTARSSSVALSSLALRGTSAGEQRMTGTTTRRYIAVFPFTLHGCAEAAHLREALVDLLSTNLDHEGMLRSVDPHALLSLVAREGHGRLDATRAGQLAGHFGAELYVIGNVVCLAGRLRINAALYDRSPNALSARHLSVAGDLEELFKLVDALTARLLAICAPGPKTASRRWRPA